jgi:hypothetical protein
MQGQSKTPQLCYNGTLHTEDCIMAGKETRKEEQVLAQRSRRLVPSEELDRWFDEVSRRWLSPFERLFPSFSDATS